MTEQKRCLKYKTIAEINDNLVYCNDPSFQNIKGLHASYLLLSLLTDQTSLNENTEKIINLINKYGVEIALYSKIDIRTIRSLINSLNNYTKIDFNAKEYVNLYKSIISKLLQAIKYSTQINDDKLNNFDKDVLYNINNFKDITFKINLIENEKENYKNIDDSILNIFNEINLNNICYSKFNKSYNTYIKSSVDSLLALNKIKLTFIDNKINENILNYGEAPEVYLKIKKIKTDNKCDNICMKTRTTDSNKKIIEIKCKENEEFENYSKFSDIITPDNNNEYLFNKINDKINFTEPNNLIIFGYGYSGAGKTYTLINNDNEKDLSILKFIINKINKESNKKNIKLTNAFELYKQNFYDISDIPNNKNKKEFMTAKGYNISKLNNNFNGTIIELDIDKDLNVKDNECTNPCTEINIDNIIKKNIDIKIDNDNINTIIKNIEEHRKNKKRIKYTINNPNSSRSHLFLLFEYELNNNSKSYFTIIDMGGSENPYDIYNNLIIKSGASFPTIVNSRNNAIDIMNSLGSELLTLKNIDNNLLLEIIDIKSYPQNYDKNNKDTLNSKKVLIYNKFKDIINQLVPSSDTKSKKTDGKDLKTLNLLDEYNKKFKNNKIESRIITEYQNKFIINYSENSKDFTIDKINFNLLFTELKSRLQNYDELYNNIILKFKNQIINTNIEKKDSKNQNAFDFLCLLYLKETLVEGFYINETINHIKWFLLNKTEYGQTLIKNNCNIPKYYEINKTISNYNNIKYNNIAISNTKVIKVLFNANKTLNIENMHDIPNDDRLSKYIFRSLYSSHSESDNIDPKTMLNIIYNNKNLEEYKYITITEKVESKTRKGTYRESIKTVLDENNPINYPNIFYFKNPVVALCDTGKDPIGIISILKTIERRIPIKEGGVDKIIDNKICINDNKYKVNYVMVSCIIGDDLEKHCDNNYKTIKFSEGISSENIMDNKKPILITDELEKLAKIIQHADNIKPCSTSES